MLLILSVILPGVCFAQIHEDVTVALVEVNVSAFDSKGEPILDLTRDDFVLKVDGRQQSVSNFSRLLDPYTPLSLRAFAANMEGTDADPIGKQAGSL